MPPTSFRLVLVPRRIVALLAMVASVLVALSILGQVLHYAFGVERGLRVIRFFYVDAESNFPTFFACLLLLAATSLLTLIACWHKRRGEQGQYHWAMLAGGFAFMAIDEFTSLHERLILPFRALLGGSELGIFYFAWVLPAIVCIAVLGLVFFRFWLRLPEPTRTLAFISALLYLGGCIGCEFLGGWYAEREGQANLTYTFIATLEESLEMAGVIVFIGTLLRYLEQQTPRLELQWDRSTSASVPTGD